MLATISDNCNKVLEFLQDVAVKSPLVIADPLSLCVDKHVRVWFCRWYKISLSVSAKNSPQDHTGLTGVLSNVATRLQNAEALCPVVAAHHKDEKETKVWDRLPPKSHRVML